MKPFTFNPTAKLFVPLTCIYIKKKYEQAYLNKNTGQIIYLMETTKCIPKYLEKRQQKLQNIKYKT